MGVTYPSLSSGAVISPSELNQNFADAISASRSLTTANLASNAAIVSRQLADRYAMFHLGGLYLPLVGAVTSATTLIDLTQTPALWTMPDDSSDPGVEIDRFNLKIRAGKSAYLCAIVLRAQAIGGTGTPVVWIGKNGTTLGAGGKAIAAAATNYELGNSSNPFDSVICSLANNDYLTIQIGESGSTPTMRGLHVDMWCKCEIGG